MTRDKAEKQKQKAKEMLGISDDRAKEIFEEQPDRKQQKKKKLQQKQDQSSTGTETPDKQEPQQKETGEDEETEGHACPECGDEFDSEQGMKVHKGQKH